MESLAGKLLIAAPRLADPHFARTVVLMIRHEEQGALGVVLNRPGTARLETIWSEMTDEPCPLDLPVMIGGPLAGPLLAVHHDSRWADDEVVRGVCVTYQTTRLQSLLSGTRGPLYVISGYSGWGSGQLEAEMTTGSWTATTATPELVFSDLGSMWRRTSRHAADEILIDWLRVRHAPLRPWHN